MNEKSNARCAKMNICLHTGHGDQFIISAEAVKYFVIKNKSPLPKTEEAR
jgi:hypothetical protein